MTFSDYLKNSALKKIDAQLILEHVSGLSYTQIISHCETELTQEQQIELENCTAKRKAGIPVEYIIGQKAFYKDLFFVNPAVLIPQPDTEILVEEAISTALKTDKRKYRVLDLCTGSGCIGISVAKELATHFDDFEIVLSDISKDALECCKKNAERILKDITYSIIQSDLFENIQGTFDLILTNPPYIESAVIPTLESDVQHEPVLALDGGSDGLDLIRKIVAQAPDKTERNGHILMEIGYNQGSSVSSLFIESGFKDVHVIKDLGMRERVVKGRY